MNFSKVGFWGFWLLVLGREKREREAKKHRCVRNIEWLPPLHALTRDQSFSLSVFPNWVSPSDLSLCGMTPKQLSHTAQGIAFER